MPDASVRWGVCNREEVLEPYGGGLKTRFYRYKSKIEHNLANIRFPITLGALGHDWNLARYVISTHYPQPACPTASTTVRSHGRF